MPKKRSDDAAPAPCFEDSLQMLEQVVADLEDGKLSLTDALARYEEGVRHLKLCYQSLRDAERKIELLAGVDAEGRPVTEPFDDAATTADGGSAPRGRRQAAASGSDSARSQGSVGDIDGSPGLF